MLSRNKKQMIPASLLTLLPMVLGLLLYPRLPELAASSWGFEGSVPLLGVFFLQPIAMLALLLFCAYFTGKDPGNQGRNQKVYAVMLWTIPVMSNLICAMFFAISLGASHAIPRLIPIFMGLMFAVIGNFMPKTRRNSTIGVKVCWALQSDENWNATHRFAGKLWFGCGIGLMGLTCLPEKVGLLILTVLIFCLAFAPMVYSYSYYQKQRKAGTAPDVNAAQDIRFTKWTLAILAVIFLFVAVTMFTGDIHFSFGKDALTVEASFYSDLTVQYDEIDSVEYRPTEDRGMRTFGFGSARLLMGAFQNDEFGVYTRYSYTGCHSAVVLKCGDRVLVLSGKTDDNTRSLFEALQAHIR